MPHSSSRPDDVGLQLLENSTATVFGLAVLILLFGPVSGAHFNPVVSAADWLLGRRAGTGISASHVVSYTVAQTLGGVVGAVLANVMFDRQVFEIATKDRITTGHLVGEIVATAGLIALIFALARTGRAALSAAAVGAYIGAAYWFTSSTSFANPAVTVGRMFSDTFAGIAPASAPGFIARPNRRRANRVGSDRRPLPRRRRGRRRRRRIPSPHRHGHQSRRRPAGVRHDRLHRSPMPSAPSICPSTNRLALKTAATRLQRDFDGMFGVETIERFLHSSYDQFAGRATVPTSCPCWPSGSPASASTPWPGSRARWTDGKPTVLFLCTHNAGRSQMALGLLHPPRRGRRRSRGPAAPNPETRSTPSPIEAMAEVGIDITGEFPKPWTDEIVQAADVVITMGCGDACPDLSRQALRELGTA